MSARLTDVDTVDLEIGVLRVSEFMENPGPLPLPGEGALDDDVLFAVDAQSSDLVGQLNRFQVDERGQFARCHCVTVEKNLGP